MLLRLRSNREQDNQWDDKAHGGLRVKETDRYYVPNLSDSLIWNERILRPFLPGDLDDACRSLDVSRCCSSTSPGCLLAEGTCGPAGFNCGANATPNVISRVNDVR